MLRWLVYTSCPGSDVVDVLHSSPFKATRFVWLGFIWVVSSGRNTIIAQHVETYKIEALDNDLIVIVMFRTATSATRCIDKCSSMDIEIAGFIKHWGQKGRTEARRYSCQWTVEISLTLIVEHRNRFTTLYSYTIGTADRQTELIVYNHCNNCQCDRTLCTTTLRRYTQTLRSMTVYTFCIPPTLECIYPTLRAPW